MNASTERATPKDHHLSAIVMCSVISPALRRARYKIDLTYSDSSSDDEDEDAEEEDDEDAEEEDDSDNSQDPDENSEEPDSDHADSNHQAEDDRILCVCERCT